MTGIHSIYMFLFKMKKKEKKQRSCLKLKNSGFKDFPIAWLCNRIIDDVNQNQKGEILAGVKILKAFYERGNCFHRDGSALLPFAGMVSMTTSN